MPGDQPPRIYGSQAQGKAGPQSPQAPKDIDLVVADPLEIANRIADLIAQQNLFPKRMVTVREQAGGSVGIYISKPGGGQPDTAIEVWKGAKKGAGLCLNEPWDMIVFIGALLVILAVGIWFGHWLASMGV